MVFFLGLACLIGGFLIILPLFMEKNQGLKRFDEKIKPYKIIIGLAILIIGAIKFFAPYHANCSSPYSGIFCLQYLPYWWVYSSRSIFSNLCKGQKRKMLLPRQAQKRWKVSGHGRSRFCSDISTRSASHPCYSGYCTGSYSR
jgi:hypothetical protein